MAILTNSIYIVVDKDTKFTKDVEIKVVTSDQIPSKNAYLITKNGIMLQKESDSAIATVEVNNISALATVEKKYKLKVDSIPGKVVAIAHKFFARVFKVHGSESALMLLYDNESKEYILRCPKQQVTHGSVNYKFDKFEKEEDKNRIFIGTIHSHCDFSAYHSGIDISDEEYLDGIHITIGHVNTNNPSIESSVVFNGNRFLRNPIELITNISLEEVKNYHNLREHKRFSFNLDENERKEVSNFNIDEWMKNVSKRNFSLFRKERNESFS